MFEVKSTLFVFNPLRWHAWWDDLVALVFIDPLKSVNVIEQLLSHHIRVENPFLVLCNSFWKIVQIQDTIMFENIVDEPLKSLRVLLLYDFEVFFGECIGSWVSCEQWFSIEREFCWNFQDPVERIFQIFVGPSYFRIDILAKIVKLNSFLLKITVA